MKEFKPEECCTCGSADCPQGIRQANAMNRQLQITPEERAAAREWYESHREIGGEG